MTSRERLKSLHGAIDLGDTEVVREFLSEDPALSYGEGPTSPLWRAAVLGHHNIVDILVSSGADPKPYRFFTYDHSKWDTILHWMIERAALCGVDHFKVVEVLIRHGFNMNACDHNHRTPLAHAVSQGNVKWTEYLLQKGASLGDWGEDSRVDCVFSKVATREDMLPVLFKYGVMNKEFRNHKADNLLKVFMKKVDEYHADGVRVVKLLLNLGVSFDEGESPLFWAVDSKNLDLVRFFIKEDADVNQWNERGEYPLLQAFRHENRKIIQLVLANGVNLNKVEYREFRNERSENLLKIYLRVVAKHASDAVKTVKVLMNSGISFNEGESPLFWAIDSENAELVSFFIEEGADVNEWNEEDKSPLFLAIARENTDIVNLLLTRGADVNLKNKLGVSPLLLAVNVRNRELVEFLISRGARVNAKDNDGWTALHEACEIPSCSIVISLMRHGADPEAEDADGDTPLMLLISDDPDDRDNYIYDCWKPVLKEYARWSFENLPISPRDLALIQGDEDAREMFENYREELDEMKNAKFHGHHSCYSILKMSRSIKKVSALAKNKEFVSKFKERLCYFGNYRSDLRRIMEKAEEFEENFQVSYDKLYPIFHRHLPKLVIEKLADNISPEDLPSP